MFGSKNKINSEELESLKEQVSRNQEFYSRLADLKDVLEATFEEMAASSDRMDAGINQVTENGKSIIETEEENIDLVASMIFDVSMFMESVEEYEENNKAVRASIAGLQESIESLVDSNKHFTSPSKDLKEISPAILSQSKEVRESIARMEDFSKQMSVLSLNAAIEAGRLGDSGKEFVAAAEEIRIFTGNYTQEINDLKEKLDASDRWAAETEDKLNHLITLLKDNNMATSRLLKPGQELVNLSKEHCADFNEDAEKISKKLSKVKEAEEEILKQEERNAMQLTDMMSESAALTSNREEIAAKLEDVLTEAREYKSIDESEDNNQ